MKSSDKAYLLDLNPQTLKDKVVLVRVDYNVPLNGTHKFHWVDNDSKIRTSIETLNYLVTHEAKVVVITHLGHPNQCSAMNDGQKQIHLEFDASFTTRNLMYKIINLLGDEVKISFCEDCIGPIRHRAIELMHAGSILLCENVKYYREDEICDPFFSQKLSEDIDIFVNEAFSISHKAYSSNYGIVNYIQPCPIHVAGFNFHAEIACLESCLSNPQRPFCAIVGGLKVTTKLSLIRSLLSHVDKMLLGGAMVFTFLKALGYNVGMSFVEDHCLEEALSIIAEARRRGVQLMLADEFLCSTSTVSNLFSDQNFGTSTCSVGPNSSIPSNAAGYDISPHTIEKFQNALQGCKTILMSGPLGVFEHKDFSSGTQTLIHTLLLLTEKGQATTFACGAETLSAIEGVTHHNLRAQLTTSEGGHSRICTQHQPNPNHKGFSHISIGGSAALTYLSSGRLPAMDALTYTHNIPNFYRSFGITEKSESCDTCSGNASGSDLVDTGDQVFLPHT